MIVVDTSALMAVLVAGARGRRADMERLVEGLGIEVAPVTEACARRLADALARWGRGRLPAALNFGDGFAYALAAERGCPVLCTGGDFARTDLGVLP